jgi:predicted kinase
VFRGFIGGILREERLLIGLKSQKYKNMKTLSSLMPIKDVINCAYEEINCGDNERYEYEKIITDCLSSATLQDKPLLIHLGGIPGAGKTTFYNNRNWPDHVLVHCDGIMEKLSAYQETLKLEGSKQAFRKFENLARIVAYELLDRAIYNKFNIIMDHGGLFTAHVDLLKNIKNKYQYQTEMHFILCDLKTAISRVAARQKITSRYTPKSIIIERLKKVKQLLPQYQDIVDCFKLYCQDTTILSE